MVSELFYVNMQLHNDFVMILSNVLFDILSNHYSDPLMDGSITTVLRAGALE